MKVPTSAKDIKAILGDNAGKEFPIYRDQNDDDFVKTIATGLLHISQSIY